MDFDNQDLEEKKANFVVADRSFTAPLLRRLVTDRFVRILPGWYSANGLTLSGGFCALSAAATFWIWPDEIIEGSRFGVVLLYVCSFLIIAYAVFDQLDGIQARRLGTSGPLGDFMDHWVDACLANLVPIPIMVILGFGTELNLAIATATTLGFWASNWETRNTNQRILPRVGGLESMIVAITLFIISAHAGVGIWQVRIFDILLLNIVFALTIPWLLVVVVHSLKSGLTRWGDFAGILLTLSPMASWIYLYADSLGGGYLYLAAFAVLGLMGTIKTGDLMRQHWIAIRYRRFDPVFVVGGLIMLLASSQARPEVPALLVAFTILMIARTLWQGVDTYRSMSVSRPASSSITGG